MSVIKFSGRVVSGKRMGTGLGFPTANVRTHEEIELPENGVYAARITIPGADGPLNCVLNQGKHPTLPEGGATIEAFILDFAGDIYGADVTVEYVQFIRGEVKFPDVEALKEQIARDVETAKGILE